jgi:predicted dehydrogenase
VVGGGLIAQLAHLPSLRALDGLFAVHAIAEPNPRVRAALARRHAIPAAFASHADLLEGPPLDALLVCSPNGTHAPVVLDALDAGLHVLVEKPLCLSPADAQAIVARARAAERVVQVGYMKRFDPAVERLLAWLPGAGPLRLATSATVDPGIATRLRPAGFIPADGGPPPHDDTAAQVAEALDDDDPRHVRAFSDAFLGALIHDVNLVADRLGTTLPALATGSPGRGEEPRGWEPVDGASADDGSLAYGAFRRADGARWTAAWQRVPSGAFREELAFHCADGVARLRFPAPYLGSAPAVLRIDGDPERVWSTPANSYVRQLEHFHACIRHGETCRAPAEQGARDVELLTELYRTAVAA